MRLYLLPISTRRALIYCQRLNQQTTADVGYVSRATHWAAKRWSDWESHGQGWQKKLTEYGNKALQRIPFEEWALKSVPPLSARRKAEDMQGSGAIDVFFPGNVIKAAEIPALLKTLGTDRQSLHLKRAWGGLAAMPLTIPFGLIPVLPNIPFLYLVYRSWSHFKALYGSRHLVFLVDNNLLKPKPSTVLENIYSAREILPPFSLQPPPPPSSTELPDERLLLDESSHLKVAKALDVPELALEIERAVKQVRKAIRSRQEFMEEKKDIESTTNTADPKKGPPPNK